MAKEDWNFGEDVATGSDTESKRNKAILRIAYLLAASDGAVREDEREVFKRTLASLEGFEMGAAETTKFIEDIVEDARKLAFLRDFYSEDEMVKAFLSKVAEDIFTLYGDKVSVRKAFSACIAICLADKEYSAFERRLVREMQVSVNTVDAQSIGAFGRSLMGGLFGPAGAIASTLAGGVLGSALKKNADKREFGPDAYVPDAFLAEVEERCVAIDQMQDRLAKCKNKGRKQSIEESLRYLAESLKDYIENVNN